MVNLTEEEIQEILNPEEDQTEIESLHLLGLHDCALAAVEQKLQHTQDISTLNEGIKTALANQRYELAADYADRLRSIKGLDKFTTHLISLAYNYAGRNLDAYIVCREAVENSGCFGGGTDFYSLACRASSIGRYEESLAYILRQLPLLESGEHYLKRKAFLDSELADAWNQAEKSTPDLKQALDFYFEDWKSIASENQSPTPERWVDHSDLSQVPKEFHVLLKPRCASTFETPPIKEAEFPELHRRYLEWQARTVAPRVHAFTRYMENCEGALLEAQPLFAEFQAGKGRLWVARSHLQAILKHSADCNPSDLADIPSLEPLLAEFRAQYKESPEAFRFLVQRSTEVTEEAYAALPPINRASGLAALYLGNKRSTEGNYLSAVQAWLECAEIWRWDSTPLLNSIFAFQRSNRFDLASKALDLVRDAELPPHTRERIERNIAHQKNDRNLCYQRPRIPTPEFGGLWPGANKEFIKWLESRTPLTTTK